MKTLARCFLIAGLLATGSLGCSDEEAERRAKQAAEKIKESMPDVVAKALAQEVAADDVKMAQSALTAAKEYQGEINGKLDSVTVNAIQAFQRTHGLRDDGILNDKTKARLRSVGP